MSEWYFSRNGNQEGPVSSDALVSSAREGKVDPNDLVWKQGMGEWLPIGQVEPFASAFTGKPAAAPHTTATTQLDYQQSYRTQGPLMFTDRAMAMLAQTKPWVRLVSIMIFAICGLAVLGIVIALIGGFIMMNSRARGGTESGVAMIAMSLVYGVIMLLYFIPATYLYRYAARIAQLQVMRREDIVEQALEAQKSFWKFIGILMVIMICLWLVIFVFAILGAALSGR